MTFATVVSVPAIEGTRASVIAAAVAVVAAASAVACVELVDKTAPSGTAGARARPTALVVEQRATSLPSSSLGLPPHTASADREIPKSEAVLPAAPSRNPFGESSLAATASVRSLIGV